MRRNARLESIPCSIRQYFLPRQVKVFVNQFVRAPRREGLRILTSLVAGLVLGISVFAVGYVGKRTNFGDARAMGTQTSSIFAKVGGFPIHCECGSGAEDCLAGIRSRRAHHSVMWLGNSQLHAVNQLRPGEENAPAILFRKLGLRGYDLVTFSQGNANFQEHYVLFEHFRQKMPIKALILPLVFDDLREDGLRDEIVQSLGDESTRQRLAQTTIGARLLERYRMNEPSETTGAAPYRPQTPQEYVESTLERKLLDSSRLWAARAEVRGDIFLGLYKLRNTVFGIKPTTKRKMIRGRYADNLAALESMLKVAADHEISVLAYIAPVGVDNGERPYDETEYRSFKVEAEVLAARYGATFANFEDLVPVEQWGRKDSTTVGGSVELDFMHFTADGHMRLAANIDSLLREIVLTGRRRQ